MRNLPIYILFTAVFCLGGCGEKTSAPEKNTISTPKQQLEQISEKVQQNPSNDVYFGNLHVHTSYSFDGYTNGSVTVPDDAYRWAKGEAINGGGDGSMLKILKPLDWYAVSEHAEYLGLFKKMEDPSSEASKIEMAKRILSKDQVIAFSAYTDILAALAKGEAIPELVNPSINQTIWQEVVETADAHYEPGKFTTFPAFEWTSHPGSRNLHRVVLFESSENVPQVPFSVLDSDRPEDLWAWMGKQRENGATLLAVAHNGNASDGLMFPEEISYGGSTLSKEYAQTRMLNEPLYEITQIKGTSETHPALSPTDEFANFELWDYTLSDSAEEPKNKKGGYARDAIIRGLQLEKDGKGNPYKFGFIGDSDTHNSASMVEEDNYRGKFGMENDANHRLNGIPGFPDANNLQVRQFSSGGLAAIWARSNTREDLYAAMIRKETYATTGPRMKVRVFAGYDIPDDILNRQDWVDVAYKKGVPMGGDLLASQNSQTPRFIVQAMKEADGANLERIQMIKGWIKDGKTHEKIYDLALSDNRKPSATVNAPAIKSTVNAADATYENSIGAVQLQVLWQDPEFDPEIAATYYVRVLQIPTPRWSTYDSKTLGTPPRKDLPVSIQERAFTSPIWYTPSY